MLFPRLLSSLGCVALIPCGCGVFQAARTGQSAALGRVELGTTRIEQRKLSDHPPITLVMRLGDPFPALAFASAHDRGSVASVALSALILARLQAHGIGDVLSTPTESGVQLALLCRDRAAGRAFITQVSAALATPVTERDPSLSSIQNHLSALKSRSFAGHAEALVAECSGELGLSAGASLPDLQTPAGRAELEQYRRFAFAARASSFAALGSTEFVNAAASDLQSVPAWPSGDSAGDAWPASDIAEADAQDGARRLSIALRLGNADVALSALDALSAESAPLSSRLRAFLPGYALERVAFQARPRGACLRVDLSLPDADPGPTPREAAEAVSLISDELHAALPRGDVAHALEDNIIEPSDPRRAAQRGAWRALTGRQEPGSERRFVALSIHPAERAAFDGFGSVLSDFETGPPRAPLETRLRAEPGQAELWLLLGSPCGTLGESNDEAGQSALALTLAARAGSAGVSLEPWLTPDAVGLLAHATRKPNETPIQQAERVARALAQALSERDANGEALALAQSELLSAAGGKPRPGYARLLDALAPEHSAWLEPRGTWASLALSNRDSVLSRSRDLLRGPLRVAVLANEDEPQARAAARVVERWFTPWRADLRRCQASAERAPRSGEISITVPDDANTEGAYVGLPFSSRLKYDREAEAIAALLNAPDGPFLHLLGSEHINAATHAQIVGGGRTAALMIEIHSSDEDMRSATLEVRRALDRVLSAPLANEDFDAAERESEQRALNASLDPRRRIVDLWRSAPPESPLSRSSLRAFQAILSGSAQVVVYVSHRD